MESWVRAVPLLREGYHQELVQKVNKLRQQNAIYPTQTQLLRALELTSFKNTKVILLGQDPYHGENQAHGLAFSVPEGTPTPPSLRNIFKEIAADIYRDDTAAPSTDLSRWAQQGVLLLNAALSVEAGKAGSHQRLGWHELTDQIVTTLSHQRRHLVFLLWGAHAQSKRKLIKSKNHLVLETAHPSPLSAYRGFSGCRHFSQTNAYLLLHGKKPIQW